MKREKPGDDILLANAIHILDKLQFLPGEGEEVGEEEDGEEGEEGGCGTSGRAILPISVVAAVFLLMQATTSSLSQLVFSHGFARGFLKLCFLS